MNGTSRIALTSEPIQQPPGALSSTTQLFQPASEMSHPKVANVSDSGYTLVPKRAPVELL